MTGPYLYGVPASFAPIVLELVVDGGINRREMALAYELGGRAYGWDESGLRRGPDAAGVDTYVEGKWVFNPWKDSGRLNTRR